MHTYSTDNERRPRVYWALSIGSYALAGVLTTAVAFISKNLPVTVGVTITAGLAYTAVLYVFNHWLWTHPLLRKMNIVRVPDLNGEWEGHIKSDYDGETYDATLSIDQTWREINVHFETATSPSDSNGATILTGKGKWPSINYQYSNEGSTDPEDDLWTHDGTADLQFIEKEGEKDVLEGIYYTAPSRGNSGSMYFVRKDG